MWNCLWRASVQLVLTVSALHFFGLPALRRYQENKVVVIISTDSQSGLPTPAVTVCPLNPNTTNGFPLNEANQVGKGFTLNSVYNFTQVTSPKDAFMIGLKPNTDYNVFLNDPTILMVSYNPPVPIIRMVIEKAEFVGRAVLIIQHHNLDLPSKPCNPSLSYTFTACVKTFLSQDVGCRLPWDLWTDTAWPLCHTLEQYRCTLLCLYEDETRDIRSNIALHLSEFQRAKPEELPKANGCIWPDILSQVLIQTENNFYD